MGIRSWSGRAVPLIKCPTMKYVRAHGSEDCINLWYRKDMAGKNKPPYLLYLLYCGLFYVPVGIILQHQMQCQRERCRRKLSWYVFGCSVQGTEESDKNCKLLYQVPGQESKHGPPECQRHASAMCEISQQVRWRMKFKIIATVLLGEFNRSKSTG